MTQEEPVTKLLQRLARTPDGIVRVIVMFVGDGGDAEEKLRLEKLARGEGADQERGGRRERRPRRRQCRRKWVREGREL